MNSNKQNLINKIIYRSQYRGTKEMDILLGKFVKSIIESGSKAVGLSGNKNNLLSATKLKLEVKDSD